MLVSKYLAPPPVPSEHSYLLATTRSGWSLIMIKGHFKQVFSNTPYSTQERQNRQIHLLLQDTHHLCAGPFHNMLIESRECELIEQERIFKIIDPEVQKLQRQYMPL